MLRGYQRAAWDLEQGFAGGATPVTQRRGGNARALLEAPGQSDDDLAAAERAAGGITFPQALLGKRTPASTPCVPCEDVARPR